MSNHSAFPHNNEMGTADVLQKPIKITSSVGDIIHFYEADEMSHIHKSLKDKHVLIPTDYRLNNEALGTKWLYLDYTISLSCISLLICIITFYAIQISTHLW